MARPKGGYINPDTGKPALGVTTVIGMLDKPALVGWAGKTCCFAGWEAGRAGEGLPVWNKVLYGQRDDAAEAGTLTHNMIDAQLRGLPLPEIPATEVGLRAEQAYTNAMQFIDSLKSKVVPHERPLVCPEYNFGGTPDFEMHGDWIDVGDFKTSAGIYPEVVIQTAAYRHLITTVEGTPIRGAHCMRFARETGDFSYAYFPPDLLDVGWEIFKHLLAIHPLRAELKKRVK